jgi:hypothetical protein
MQNSTYHNRLFFSADAVLIVFSVFTKRENIEAIGERLNRQLRVPRQHAFGDTPLAVA